MLARTRSLVHAFLVFALTTSCGERVSTSYADFAAAQTSGAVARGWVPGWLPNSASELHEIHDVDTNQSMLTFDYGRSSKFVIPESCVANSGPVPDPPFAVRWWPELPKGTNTGTHLYVCESGAATLLVREADSRVWYWRS